MISLILTAHGHFAEGILSAAELITGKSTHCQTINFIEGMSSETLREQLATAARSTPEIPLLILTDLIGGTPFREAVLLAQTRNNTEVLTGMNLTMVIEALMERHEANNFKIFANQLIINAKHGILHYQISHKSSIPHNKNDGI